jgi:ankyrin repeat protein
MAKRTSSKSKAIPRPALTRRKARRPPDLKRFGTFVTSRAGREGFRVLTGAPWGEFAETARPEVEAYLAALPRGTRAVLISWDLEGTGYGITFDADTSSDPFAEGLIEPKTIVDGAAFMGNAFGWEMEALAEEPYSGLVAECLVLLCAELVVKCSDEAAGRLAPGWVLAVEVAREATPHVVYRSGGRARTIFDTAGGLALRPVEELIDETPDDGRALAGLLRRIPRSGFGPDLLEKVDRVFHRVATSGDLRAGRAEVRALVEALADTSERLELARWGELSEKVLAHAVVCVKGDRALFLQLVDRVMPEKTTEPVLAHNVACIATLLGERELALGWIRTALVLGRDPQKIKHEPDFTSLRGDGEFEALLATPLKSQAALDRELVDAIARVDLESLRSLLDQGADVTAEVEGEAILEHALSVSALEVRRNKPAYLQMVGVLMEHGATLSRGAWPWYRLVGEPELLEAVLDQGVPVDERLVGEAIEKGSLEALQLLERRGVDLRRLDQGALLQRCRLHQTDEILRYLLQRGFQIDARGEGGRTLAIVCSFSGNMKLLDSVLAAGADPLATDVEGKSASSHALFNDMAEFLEHLAGRGVSLSQVDGMGRGLVHLAVDACATRSLDTLLRLGAPVDTRDQDGRTALHCAAEHGNEHAARKLIEKGASRSALDAGGRSPKDLAETSTLRKLLAGADA